jgi:hypothetical protein
VLQSPHWVCGCPQTLAVWSPMEMQRPFEQQPAHWAGSHTQWPLTHWDPCGQAA